MRKLSANGAIGLLITLLIISVVFIMTMPALKNSGSVNLNSSSIKQESIEEEVNQKLNDIQNMRNQAQQLPNYDY